jgi:hypothetical protein
MNYLILVIFVSYQIQDIIMHQPFIWKDRFTLWNKILLIKIILLRVY